MLQCSTTAFFVFQGPTSGLRGGHPTSLQDMYRYIGLLYTWSLGTQPVYLVAMCAAVRVHLCSSPCAQIRVHLCSSPCVHVRVHRCTGTGVHGHVHRYLCTCHPCAQHHLHMSPLTHHLAYTCITQIGVGHARFFHYSPTFGQNLTHFRANTC